MRKITFVENSGVLYFNREQLGKLNNAESILLRLLFSKKGQVIEKKELIEKSWPMRIMSPNALNMAIKKIRQCFEVAGFDDVIITHVKVGFSWNEKYEIDYISPTLPLKKPLFTSSELMNGAPPPIFDEKNKKATRNELFRKAIYLFILLFMLFYFIFSALFYSLYWPTLTCVKISQATFCGVGGVKKDEIKEKALSGYYVYGYTDPERKFKYEKIR